MLFKFLTGKEIGHLQTGLILSQMGGLLMLFTGLMIITAIQRNDFFG
jgi:hypothetical protein